MARLANTAAGKWKIWSIWIICGCCLIWLTGTWNSNTCSAFLSYLSPAGFLQGRRTRFQLPTLKPGGNNVPFCPWCWDAFSGTYSNQTWEMGEFAFLFCQRICLHRQGQGYLTSLCYVWFNPALAQELCSCRQLWHLTSWQTQQWEGADR